MKEQEQLSKNLERLVRPKTTATKSIYKYGLTYFIEDQIYAHDPEAKDYVLGEVHREWDALLQDNDRLRLLAPRDHLKTFYFSVAYVVYRLAYYPNDEIYIFSKTDAQAVKILDQVKRYIRNSPELSKLMEGDGVDFWTKKSIRTNIGSTVHAQGYGGSIRGAHPNLIIMDDVLDQQILYSDEQNLKSIERYFADILPMAEPETKIIIVGTLQREDDLYSSLDPEEWTIKTYSAIVDEEKQQTLYPEKWPWDLLMKRKKEISYLHGDRFFLKEYCNMPIQLTGEIIKKEWIKWYQFKDLPDGDDYIGFDLSVGKDPLKGDYTVGAVVRHVPKTNDFYLRHIFRDRIDFAKRLRKVQELYESYKTTRKVRIESNTFQNDTVQTLIKETSIPIEGIQTSKNKDQKFAEDLAPIFENGRFYIPEGAEWVNDFVNEILALPRGKYDDQADAVMIAINKLGLKPVPRIRHF